MISVTRPPAHNRNDFEIALLCVSKAGFDIVQALSNKFGTTMSSTAKHKETHIPIQRKSRRAYVPLEYMPGIGKVKSANVGLIYLPTSMEPRRLETEGGVKWL